MKITLKRGELFQIARDAVQLKPAQPSDAERFRRFVQAVLDVNEPSAKLQREEYELATKDLPQADRTQEALDKIADDLASKPLFLHVEIKEIQAFTRACMAVWSAQGGPNGLGMPFNILKALKEDLEAIGSWKNWSLGTRLLVDDPSLDLELPPDLFPDEDALDDELPPTAFEGTSDETRAAG